MPSPSPTEPEEMTPLETQTYRFSVPGTRPVLEFLISSGKVVEDGGGGTEKLRIEVHTPVSGEIFEAKTSKGRIEVDRDGRLMYFSQAADSVSFTLFLGHSVVVTMRRKTGEVLLETPSRIVSVERGNLSPGPSGLGAPATTDSVRVLLE